MIRQIYYIKEALKEALEPGHVTRPLDISLPFSGILSTTVLNLCFFYNYFLYLVVNELVLSFYFLISLFVFIFLFIFLIGLLTIFLIIWKTSISKKKKLKHSLFKSYLKIAFIIIFLLLFTLGL